MKDEVLLDQDSQTAFHLTGSELSVAYDTCNLKTTIVEKGREYTLQELVNVMIVNRDVGVPS